MFFEERAPQVLESYLGAACGARGPVSIVRFLAG